jgi:hypothetical protein
VSLTSRLSVLSSILLLSSLMLGRLHQENSPQTRDSQSLEILARTVQAAGGYQAIAAVRDITEEGDITFYWNEQVIGPVTIKILGENHFRMDADVSQQKRTWTIRNGVGFKIEDGKRVSMTSRNAVNLEGLSYPIALVLAALRDVETAVLFMAVEKQGGRSVYRLRLKGRLGLSDKATPIGTVSKDLIIDALTYDILEVEDYPYQIYAQGGKVSKVAPRAIEFGDFRSVAGLRIPFSITTKLQKQRTLSIHLNTIQFNSNLSDKEFELGK